LKSVDFLMARPEGALWFVEAKSSSPRAPERLAVWLAELCEKVARTAAALLSVAIGRPLGHGLDVLQTDESWLLTHAVAPWEVVLVIPTHEKAWLAPLRDALRDALRPLGRSFGIRVEPKVLNAELAWKLGLGPRPGPLVP
jgi:hypothetical protein